MQEAAASYKSELLSESDEDDRERKRLRTDNTAASRCVRVETIVQRLCRCQRQTCCTQFQSSSGIQTIERVRATFAALANHEKERFLQDALRVKPNFQSEIYSENRLMVSSWSQKQSQKGAAYCNQVLAAKAMRAAWGLAAKAMQTFLNVAATVAICYLLCHKMSTPGGYRKAHLQTKDN